MVNRIVAMTRRTWKVKIKRDPGFVLKYLLRLLIFILNPACVER
jgi:hypothetical protein